MPLKDALATADIHIQATYRLTEALVDAEKKMRRRVQLLSEVVFEMDSEGRLLFLNEAWRSTLGYSPEGCLGTRLRDYVLEEDRHALDSDFLSGVEVRLRHSNDGVVWMECSATALDEGGFVGALRDVTQQKRTRDELARLSLVASSTENLVVITDKDGGIEWVNHAFTVRTGYEIHEVRGRKPGTFLQGPGTDPKTVLYIAEQLAKGVSFTCEILNYSKSGEAYWTSLNVTPVRNAAGQTERFISVQTDVTGLRRVQQELVAAKEAAEAASEAKTNFLATISHEMRTPLNVILGATELALEGVSASDYLLNLRRINDSGETLLRLISDLLDISKIEAGQVDLEKLAFNLRDCLHHSLEPLWSRAREKQLELQLVCDERLPELIVLDPGRLGQIITKLAENAVKFTDSGKVLVEARLVEAEREAPDLPNELLEIRVHDTGPGISPGNQERIFERFVQVDSSTTRAKGGAGLGLSIVKSLSEALGGVVEVESSPGLGSDFRVRLPLVRQESAVSAGNIESPEASLARPPVGRILVAEDNDSNYAIVHRHLTLAGHRVERAENGRIAAEAAGAADYDLILMDIEMPELDGIEATKRIRFVESAAGKPGVPILALTAHAVDGYRDRCLQAGCTGFLAKPVRKPALLEAVHGALLQNGSGGVPALATGVTEASVPVVFVETELADLVPLFLENCRRDAASMDSSAASLNWEDVIRLAHSMKGAAPSYGFDEIGRLGRRIEEAGRARDASSVSLLTKSLQEYLRCVRVECGSVTV